MSIRIFIASITDKLSKIIFPDAVTTSSALAELDAVKAKLSKAIENHDALATAHQFESDRHAALAEGHDYAAARAERVRAKLDDLLG